MRRFTLLATVLVAAGSAVAAASGLPASATSSAVSSSAVSSSAASGQVVSPSAAKPGSASCRTGTVQVSPDLSATGTVCARYSGGSWVGSGSVTLTATRVVKGTTTWGPAYLPSLPSVFNGGSDFAVRPGHPVTITIKGTDQAQPEVTGITWVLWIGTPNGNRATGFEAQLMSPVVTRTSKPTAPSGFTGSTGWACDTKPVTGYGLKGDANVCVRQVKGAVQTKGTLTYTSPIAVDVRIGHAVDGVLRVTDTNALVPAATGKAVTVTLPTAVTQALAGDNVAATFVAVENTISSPQIALS
jgi:hypothetical protein